MQETKSCRRRLLFVVSNGVSTIEGKLRCAYWKILTCAKKLVIPWEYDAEVGNLGCMKILCVVVGWNDEEEAEAEEMLM